MIFKVFCLEVGEGEYFINSGVSLYRRHEVFGYLCDLSAIVNSVYNH